MLRKPMACLLLALVVRAPLTGAQQDLSIADSHLAAAQAAQRSGDYGTAGQEYRAAIDLVPGYAEVHMNLGLTYQMQGRTADAMAELRRAVELKPGLAGANLMLGIDLCKLGQGANAIPYLVAAIALDHQRAEAYAWLATAQELSGDHQAELLTIQKGLKVEPKDIDLLYLEGHTYELLGREQTVAMDAAGMDKGVSERLLAESYAISAEWPLAAIHFQNAVAFSPTRSGLHVELAEVLLRVGRLDPALREFDKELLTYPRSVRAIVGRGEAELLENDLDRAMADWSHALAIDARYTFRLLGVVAGSPGLPTADELPTASIVALDSLRSQLLLIDSPASRLAVAYIARQHGIDSGTHAFDVSSLGDTAKLTCTEAALRRSIRDGRISDAEACGPDVIRAGASEELRISIAGALLELGDYQHSLKALAAGGDSEAAAAEVRYLRARCFEELSTAAYLSLYQADPNSFRLHQLMGDFAAARGEDKKAIEEYRQAIALKPAIPNLHYSLAHVLWKNSDIAAARVEYEAELAISPTHAGALHDLGQTYLMEHQPDKALSLLNQAAAAGARGSDIDRDLGTAYTELGQYRSAEQKYLLAVSGDHDGSIHFKLARVYRALGEKEKAARESALAADLNRKYHGKLQEQTPRLSSIND